MPISNVKQMVDAELEGRTHTYMWRKNPSQVTTAGIWFDVSAASGNPPAKNWFDATPLTAQQVKWTTDKGIFHGHPVSPATKYLRSVTTRASVVTALPMTMILCDYLLYYPTIDDSTTDPQEMDNSLTLPRYTDGEGVQMMAITLAARTGGQTFSISYTNQDGTAGRISQTVVQNTSSVIGTVTTSTLTPTTGSVGPFIGLQAGDTGVRSVDSVTMNGADTGYFAIVLVKPLLQTAIKEITAPYEKDAFLQDGLLPIVQNDAYLSFLALPNGSLAATGLLGDVTVVWSAD